MSSQAAPVIAPPPPASTSHTRARLAAARLTRNEPREKTACSRSQSSTVVSTSEADAANRREPAGARVESARHALARRPDADRDLKRLVSPLGRHRLHLLGEGQHPHPLAVLREQGDQLARGGGGGGRGPQVTRDLVGQVVVDVEATGSGLGVGVVAWPHQAGAANARAK